MEERQYFEKVAYIVPSNRIQAMAEQTLAEEITQGWISVIQIDPTRIQEEYDRLLNEGYGCIIARGGTFHDLNALDTTVPVVEERIRTADILEMTAKYFAKHSKPVYVVIHEDIAVGLENLQALIPEKFRVRRYRSIEELKVVLEEIPEQEAEVFTSGIASKLEIRSDLHLWEIVNRAHTVKTSAEAAYNLLQQMKSNITQVNIMDSVYNNIDEGILIFRPDNTVTELNIQAEKMLHLGFREAIGQDVYQIIPDMPPKKKDGTCSVETPTTFMRDVNGRKLNFSIYPFEFFRGSIRNMVIIQDVTRIQEAERKIRMQLSKKGLVAERTFDDVITNEPVMEHVVNRAKRVATFDGSVLIYGESGTGKELFAQSIHNASERRNGPFVAVNCGALTDSLLESELFGYVGGAFTGARKEGKAGLFELAHRGTIFLDEINSTTMSLQTKILRVLEERQVMRVGSDYVIPLDIRIISASNTNLSQDVEQGRFRRDLFFRLNTFQVLIPPVRERKKDIVPLFKYYYREFSGHEPELSPEFIRDLESHYWLGNVRELRSVALRYHAFDGDNSRNDILNLTTDGPDGSNANSMETSSATPEGFSTPQTNETKTTESAQANQNQSPESAMNDSVRALSASVNFADDETVSLADLSKVVEDLVIESLEGRGLTKSQIAQKLGISRQALYKKLKKTEEYK